MGYVILVLIWIFAVVITWIGLAYFIADMAAAMVYDPDGEGFIRSLSHPIVIGSALILGTIITARAYSGARKSRLLLESS